MRTEVSAALAAHGRRRTRGIQVAAVVATAAAVFGAVRATATPPAGIVGGPIVARGPVPQEVVVGVPRMTTVTRTVRIRVGRKTVAKRVRFEVATVQPHISCGASRGCEIAFQQLTIAPGGHTGWHTHPGPTFVAVAQGEGTLYHGMTGCPSHKYGAGSGFFQPSTEVHNFRNEGSSELVVYGLYLLPPGTPNTGIRIDQPQPSSCTQIP